MVSWWFFGWVGVFLFVCLFSCLFVLFFLIFVWVFCFYFLIFFFSNGEVKCLFMGLFLPYSHICRVGGCSLGYRQIRRGCCGYSGKDTHQTQSCKGISPSQKLTQHFWEGMKLLLFV